ncbi:GTP-binding protein Parf [Phytophthora palmivora]|uniref:GTP-binding protein Parf n=1 Tax=Phytophthora palmivora TaxID=4796 RepID=A0A2P4XV06_9STRA|nr:GTP-binding protein Parf [Phytophthora palmivora]
MDKAIRRRVRGGITYNMKLLIRGAKGTGKTSLFHRLKGEPIPEGHQSTPQLQSATINWSFRQNLEENVKCEVWDVVDKGFVPVDAEEEGAGPQNTTEGSAELGGLQSGGNLSANAAAAAAAATMQNGTHSVAIVDASTVDVYHEAHGVIFLLDVTKWDTLEYVKQQLDNVPVHIPTLVLVEVGNY